MIRSFIALDLPSAVRRELRRTAEPFKRLGLDARFSAASSIHLTLKFLGDVEAERIDLLAAQIKGAASVHPPFSLRLGTLGVFPDRRRPRVLWRGLRGIAPLLELQRGISAILAQEGFEPEKRPYAPHLTLARLRSPRKSQALIEEMEAFNGAYQEDEAPVFEVGQVHLFKSVLKPSGAEYTILASASLGSTS
ncbi:MAG TPA: RNA 2',3'-cyclic phosphodiesterase [Acidobacteriota bacterium]|nr:RNA 2',3'-cyclic phosphodiesterase [Acidobacteriota bacterium]